MFFDCHTSKAQESVHYFINLDGIVFILQWHYSCDKRMKNPATLPDWALIAVFPTHRRTMVRIRKLKMENLISAEFPDKNDNIQMSLQPNSVSKGLICQLSWPSPMVNALNSIWLQQPTKCIQRKKLNFLAKELLRVVESLKSFKTRQVFKWCFLALEELKASPILLSCLFKESVPCLKWLKC